MLTLAHPRAQPSTLRLHRIASWCLDEELRGYLDASLQRRWPGVVVERVEDARALQRADIDLWVCAEPPPLATLRPALLLGGVARGSRLTRDAEQRWTCTMPVTAQTLIGHIERLLASP